VTAAVRDRYDGAKRNPWNEIECGSNYARSMASWGAVIILSGFTFDSVRGHIGFRPKVRSGETFRSFWSGPPAYGTVEMSEGRAKLSLIGGALALASLGLPLAGTEATGVSLNERPWSSGAKEMKSPSERCASTPAMCSRLPRRRSASRRCLILRRCANLEEGERLVHSSASIERRRGRRWSPSPLAGEGRGEGSARLHRRELNPSQVPLRLAALAQAPLSPPQGGRGSPLVPPSLPGEVDHDSVGAARPRRAAGMPP